jgi:hypothetical protein
VLVPAGGVAVGGTTTVAVGGTEVAVGGTDVAVGGTVVAVGGTAVVVTVGGTEVAVGGTPTSPLQAVPLTAKSVGIAKLPVKEPWKPKETEPPFAPTVPFQWPAELLAVTLLPLCEMSTFQALVATCPGV